MLPCCSIARGSDRSSAAGWTIFHNEERVWKWKFRNIVTLILIRKLEAGDATCGRLDEEMLGRRFYLAATG